MNPIFNYLDLVGKPFRFGGRGPDEYDCWGLARECLVRQGFSPPDYPSSEEGQVNGLQVEIATETSTWIRHEAPVYGAVVAFNMIGFVSHVGIVVARDRFLHITKHTRACVERLSHPLWSRRIAGFYALDSSQAITVDSADDSR